LKSDEQKTGVWINRGGKRVFTRAGVDVEPPLIVHMFSRVLDPFATLYLCCAFAVASGFFALSS
jgi:hypothetical protein